MRTLNMIFLQHIASQRQGYKTQAILKYQLYRGPYMGAQVFIKLGKRDELRGLLSIISLFLKELNKLNNIEHECDSINYMALKYFEIAFRS